MQTEHWALEAAHEADVPAASSTLEFFGDRAAIVVARYDRANDGSRIHQEDFCQSLGLEPNAKYESTAEADKHGSRLSRLVARAAPRSMDPDHFRTALLRQLTFNVVIGNGDAHSKNYSLLIGPRGEVAMAPLYDAASD